MANELERTDGTPASPSPYACPECHGVLSFRRDDEHGYVWFECRIGHTFTARDLLLSLEAEVERNLLVMLRSLSELEAFVDELRERHGTTPSAAACEARAGALRRDIEEVRRLIDGNDPILVEPG